MARRASALALATAIAACPALVVHADVAAVWDGTNNNWSNAVHWTTNPTFPNNGTPPATLYDVTINAGTVALDVSPTIQQLSIGSASISGPGTLTVVGSADFHNP